MAANIEVKANLHSPQRQSELAQEIAGVQPEILVQRDTFYHSQNGRLKLREIQGQTAQLIHYDRSNDPQVRKSDYVITPVVDVPSMNLVLQRTLGVRGVVAKTRTLWIVGQTRIHFDSVADLGAFAELEFVLNEGQSEDEAHTFVGKLLDQLEIRPDDLIDLAYIDLLEKQTSLNTAR